MKYKFSLQERQFISMDTCRTIYETNIDIRSNPNIAMLKNETIDGICQNLGIDDPRDINFDFTVRLNEPIGLKYTEGNYALTIHESGRIKRLPDKFYIDTGSGR